MKKLLTFITITLMLGVAPYAAAGGGSDPADVHTPECADVQAQAQDAAGELDAAVPWDGYNQRLVKARKVVKRALRKREITRDCASCIEAAFIHNVAVDEHETCGPTCFDAYDWLGTGSTDDAITDCEASAGCSVDNACSNSMNSFVGQECIAKGVEKACNYANEDLLKYGCSQICGF